MNRTCSSGVVVVCAVGVLAIIAVVLVEVVAIIKVIVIGAESGHRLCKGWGLF